MGGEVARKSACGLRAWSLAAVEVEGQADNESADTFFGDDRGNRFRVGGELCAPMRLIRRCDSPGHIGESETNGLGPYIEAE